MKKPILIGLKLKKFEAAQANFLIESAGMSVVLKFVINVSTKPEPFFRKKFKPCISITDP
jgi:hypothetical protein